MPSNRDKLEQVQMIVARMIEEWTDKQFHGNITINFNAGSVPNINVNRSIRLPESK